MQIQRTKTETRGKSKTKTKIEFNLTEELQKGRSKSKPKPKSVIVFQMEKTKTFTRTKTLTKTEPKQKQIRTPVIPYIPRSKTVLMEKTKSSLLEKTSVGMKQEMKQETKSMMEYKPISFAGVDTILVPEMEEILLTTPGVGGKQTSKTISTPKSSSPMKPIVSPVVNPKIKIPKKGRGGVIGSSRDPLKVKLKFIQKGKIVDLF